METITKTFNVYDYTELSEQAKEKVHEWHLDDDLRPQMFEEDIEMWLSENFKDSELKVQFSLSYRQGDGLNIYGKVYLDKLYEKIRERLDFNLSEKEQKFIKWVLSRAHWFVEIPQNWRYCYCIADRVDFAEEIIQDLEYDGIRGINFSALEKFNELCQNSFTDLCGEYEDAGYKYLYEPDEDEIENVCAANEWKFTEDGELYC